MQIGILFQIPEILCVKRRNWGIQSQASPVLAQNLWMYDVEPDCLMVIWHDICAALPEALQYSVLCRVLCTRAERANVFVYSYPSIRVLRDGANV